MRRIGVEFKASDPVVYWDEGRCLWSVDRFQGYIPSICHSAGEQSVPGCGGKLIVRGARREGRGVF